MEKQHSSVTSVLEWSSDNLRLLFVHLSGGLEVLRTLARPADRKWACVDDDCSPLGAGVRTQLIGYGVGRDQAAPANATLTGWLPGQSAD